MPGGFGTGVDIATLGIRVDAREVRDATGALSELQQQGSRVEQTTDRVTTSSRGMGRGMGVVATQLERAAIQTTGLNATLVRMGSTMLTFARGGVVTIAVLGGLAAVGAAWRKITQDAREAEEAQRNALAALLSTASAIRASATGRDPELAANIASSIEGVRSRTRQIAELREQQSAIRGGRGSRSTLARQSRVAALQEEIDALVSQNRIANALIETAQGAQAESIFEASLRRATDRVKELGSAIRHDLAGFDPGGAPGVPGDSTLVDVLSPPGTTGFRITPGFEVSAANQQSLVNDRIAAERDLAQAREDANLALIFSLENVGRAYGGVTDQIFSLTSATLRLAQSGGGGTPVFASGNVGGLTGLATGVGLLSAVGGIVDGLLNAGERARQAARVWENAFQQFERMFDDPGTELEQNLRAIDDAFNAIVQGLQDNLTSGNASEFEKAIRRLEKARKDNVKQAKELEEAERDLHDARFQALNAPSGLNLALYGYGASLSTRRGLEGGIDFGAIGVPDGGGSVTISGDVKIDLKIENADDPEAAAAKIWKAIKRQGKRGGPKKSAAR